MSTFSSTNNKLQPTLGVLDVVAITVSGISPASSLFVIAPFAIQQAGSGAFLAFLMASFLALMFAFCYAELGRAHSSAGGEYVYARRIFGGMAGFVTFVTSLLVLLFVPPLMSTGAATYLNSAFNSQFDPQITGLLVVVIAYAVSILDIKLNAWITGVFLLIEIIALLLIIYLGFSNISQPISIIYDPQIVNNGVVQAIPWALVISSVGTALLSYNGFGAAVLLAEDMKCKGRGVHKAVLLSLFIVVILEILPLLALLLGSPSLEALINSADPFGYLILTHSNGAIRRVVSACVFLCVFNAIIAIIVAVGRVVFSSGRDALWTPALNRLFTSIHPRFKSPWLATLFLAFPSALLTLSSSLSELTSFSVLLVMLLYFVVAACALMSRLVLKDHYHPYKMPLWPWPALFALSGAGILLFKLISEAKIFDLIIISFVLIFSCIYYKRRKSYNIKFQEL